jgi:hypothetical protein
MNDVDKAKWQELVTVEVGSAYGLKIDGDPLNFFYRAKVERSGFDWCVTVWQIYTRDIHVTNPRGQWVEIGTYRSLQGAKIRARRMAKLFEATSRLGGS